jgi:diguanylate cyclase (GGDEF)-like protein
VAFARATTPNNGVMTPRDRPPSRAGLGMIRIGRAVNTVGHGPLASTAVRVWTFTIFLAVAAFVGYLLRIRSLAPLAVPVWLPWPLLAAGFFLTELKVIEVHFRRETHAFSLSEIPAVIGLFFVPPDQYLLALLAGTAAALLLTSRQSWVKATFNLANYVFVAVAAIVIFRAIGRFEGPPDPLDWVAAFAAMLVASGIGALDIATAITLSGGAPQFRKLPEMLQFGGLVAIANTSLALLAVAILWYDPSSIWLLALPLITLFLAYRAYISEREKHERLEMLYRSSRILQHSPELDVALLALLDHAREMFRAEVAEVVLDPGPEASQVLRTTSLHDGRSEVMVPVDRSVRQPDVEQAIATRRPIFSTPDRTPGGRVMVIKRAMIAPLVGESATIGTLTIANRLTEGTKFEDDDLRLLETLANQAAVALENGQLEQSLAELGRLKDELRYQAYHDPLTNLPNRSMFAEHVETRLRGPSRGDLLPVVLFLDLDDFKIVNDTLGHAAGDLLLVSVGERIRECIRGMDLAARLGGDEFAILLDDTPSLELASTVARRLIDALGVSFPLVGDDVVIGASIGIAMARSEDQTADELLRNADVAMYTAKALGKRRFAVFEPTMHAAIVARHELSAELARGINRDELVVYHQPIVDLSTGRAYGLEALVRWRHPTRGLVLPDDFIGLSEETGSILALGHQVMERAEREVGALNQRFEPADRLSLSVNVSPIQLQQPDFLDEVEAVLVETGFEPDRLILEITETAMFRDTQATIRKLQALRERGVRIAIDDFGTGYSSLSYLRRFPVDILKIAKDFIGPADGDSGEWAFAAAIIALGRALDLRIVAEGIEDTGQLDRLRELGCEFGQGYLFARPGPIEGVASVLGLTGAKVTALEAATPGSTGVRPPGRRNASTARA